MIFEFEVSICFDCLVILYRLFVMRRGIVSSVKVFNATTSEQIYLQCHDTRNWFSLDHDLCLYSANLPSGLMYCY